MWGVSTRRDGVSEPRNPWRKHRKKNTTVMLRPLKLKSAHEETQTDKYKLCDNTSSATSNVLHTMAVLYPFVAYTAGASPDRTSTHVMPFGGREIGTVME